MNCASSVVLSANSLHCDEMGYLCRVPYWRKPVSCANRCFSENFLEKDIAPDKRVSVPKEDSVLKNDPELERDLALENDVGIGNDGSNIRGWLSLRRNRLRPVYIKTAFRCWNHSSEAGRPGKLYRFYGA